MRYAANPDAAVHMSLRTGLLSFGLLLAILAIWIVLPEYYRPHRIRFPADREKAEATQLDLDNSKRAASLALIRGDLWAESALTSADLLWKESAARRSIPGNSLEVRTQLERALDYSPHRGDAWLMLAAMSDRYNWPGYQLTSLLKMSYYTAPNEPTLLPLRVAISLRPNGLQDPEIQDMIKRDVRVIVTRTPALKPTLAATYAAASRQGKAFLQQVLLEIDPSYLATMPSGL